MKVLNFNLTYLFLKSRFLLGWQTQSKRFALILQKLGYNVRLVTWSDGPMRTQFESAGLILV